MGEATNHVQNGLLLRADVHNLFDLGYWAIDTDTMTIVLSEALLASEYGYLQGKKLNLPKDETLLPSKEALVKHRSWSGL